MSEAKNTTQTGSFPMTRWTLVAKLKGPPSAESAQALDSLCRAYWYPLYVFARRHGLDEMDAKDAVQDLFARMIEGNRLAQADAERGRMRTFLLAALKNEIGMGPRKAAGGQAWRQGHRALTRHDRCRGALPARTDVSRCHARARL